MHTKASVGKNNQTRDESLWGSRDTSPRQRLSVDVRNASLLVFPRRDTSNEALYPPTRLPATALFPIQASFSEDIGVLTQTLYSLFTQLHLCFLIQGRSEKNVLIQFIQRQWKGIRNILVYLEMIILSGEIKLEILISPETATFFKQRFLCHKTRLNIFKMTNGHHKRVFLFFFKSALSVKGLANSSKFQKLINWPYLTNLPNVGAVKRYKIAAHDLFLQLTLKRH